jgi:16S rRNA C1402 (ribose-2'-O) methylase RsmI
VAERYAGEPPRGEVVLVVAPSERAGPEEGAAVDAAEALARLVESGARPRPAAAVVAELTGLSANAVYRAYTERSRSKQTEDEG